MKANFHQYTCMVCACKFYCTLHFTVLLTSLFPPHQMKRIPTPPIKTPIWETLICNPSEGRNGSAVFHTCIMARDCSYNTGSLKPTFQVLHHQVPWKVRNPSLLSSLGYGLTPGTICFTPGNTFANHHSSKGPLYHSSKGPVCNTSTRSWKLRTALAVTVRPGP